MYMLVGYTVHWPAADSAITLVYCRISRILQSILVAAHIQTLCQIQLSHMLWPMQEGYEWVRMVMIQCKVCL